MDVNMRIALFFENDKLSHLNNKDSRILIFDIENERVTGVATIDPDTESEQDRLSILKKKQVDEVYLSTIDDDLKEKISKLDIRVKTAPMLEIDKLFNSLYISGCMV